MRQLRLQPRGAALWKKIEKRHRSDRAVAVAKSVLRMYLQFNYPSKKNQYAKGTPQTAFLKPHRSSMVRKYKTRQFSTISRCSACQSEERTSQTTDGGSSEDFPRGEMVGRRTSWQLAGVSELWPCTDRVKGWACIEKSSVGSYLALKKTILQARNIGFQILN